MQIPYSETRKRVSQRDQGRDDNSENMIRAWDDYIKELNKYPQFQANIIAFADHMDIAIMLADSVGAEAVESGTYKIEEIRTLEGHSLDFYYGDNFLLKTNTAADNFMSNFLSLYTLNEIRPMFSFPILNQGETIERVKETDPVFYDDGLYLGLSETGYKVTFPIKLFKKHAFISGVPGGGKTNTMLYLVTTLWRQFRIPFLVLEPAKQEYRALARIPGMEELCIFSPRANTRFPLHINPFEFPIGLTLAEHIANLKAVFEGAFELPPPSPHFIDTCIEQVYIDKGWNTFSTNDGKLPYPTMQDLYDSLKVAVEKSSYEGEIRGNLRAVLEVRVGSLLKREIGNVYNVKHSIIRPEEWLDVPAIIELEALGEGPANFMSLLISTLIRESLRIRMTVNKQNNRIVNHIIFYEEAHNLIGPDTDSPLGDSVDPKISATKYLVKMLAEVGHYTGDYRSPVMQTAQAVVDYNNWINNGGIGMQRIDYRKNGGAVQGIVTAQNIFDVFDVDSPNFWNYKSRSQSDYIDMASHIPLVRMHLDNGKSLADIESMGGVLGACATQYFRNPVQVMKYGDAYIHCSDGRHRTVAAQIAKVEMPVAIVQEFHTSDKSRLFDETIKTIIRPEILANILYSEARLKKSGTGAYARLQRNQNNWNDMGIQVYDEHGKEIVKPTDAKTYEESYVDIQKAKGTALEEAIAYTLRPNSKKIQIQRVVQSAKGRSTKPDVIALNATHDIKIGGEYVVAGESIVIEAKCGDAFYLTSEIEHIAHQLSGYDKLEEELKPEMKGRLHRTLMLTQDYERMSDAAKKALNEVAKKYKTSISILPFYACDMTRAVMLADVRGKLNV